MNLAMNFTKRSLDSSNSWGLIANAIVSDKYTEEREVDSLYDRCVQFTFPLKVSS